MRTSLSVALVLAGAVTVATAQVPLPFPKPGSPATPVSPLPPRTAPPADAPPAVAPPQDAGEPPEGSLGVMMYPAAQFITSYDAGKGQRYYLYGTMTPYAEIVQYFRNTLRQRGDEVFEQPPVHQFDLGRFREETMAFQPSVTVKDYTWGGTGGYLNPKRGAEPARFPTIIQVVPNPPGAGR
ncbi:MAG: hypothetical protein WD227_14770 [Vicinamibacterales bacterium]